MKRREEVLYIKNFKDDLNIVNLYHILYTKEIFFDDKLLTEINFLKKFKV